MWNQLKVAKAGCARIKKLLVNRPFGFKRFGRDAAVSSPWVISGRKFVEIGESSAIMSGCRIEAICTYAGKTYHPLVSIGANVYIGRMLFITAIQEVRIGDGSVLSDYVYVADSSHGFDPEHGLIMEQRLESKGPVRIGSNCFLGYRVTVMPGVILGDWCIVGAHSVVTQSFSAYSMIAGSPARLIRRYSHELGEWISVTKLTSTESG